MNVLRDCHTSMINSCSVAGSIFSDIRIICKDGSISYSKLLLSFVDPAFANILQEKNEDDVYQKIVLCPDFQRKEFIESWQAILFTSDVKCTQDSLLATSKVVKSKPTVQSDDEDCSQLTFLEDSSFTFDDHDPVNRRTSAEQGFKINDVLCNFCGRSFPNEEKLKKHFYNTHHASKNRFECFECKKMFSSQTFLLKHKSSEHKEDVKKCPICFMLLTTIAEYKLHEKSHTAFKCTVCGKTNSNKFNHQRHLLLHDKTQKFNCECCGKKFSLKHQLDRHKLIHTKKINQLIFCPNCNRSFNRNENMKRHLAKCKI